MGWKWDGTAIARFVIRFSPYRILTQFSNLYRHACVQRIVGLVRNYVSCCWRLRRNPRDTIKQVAGFCGTQGPALPKMHQCTNEGAPSILRSTVPTSNRWRRKIPLFRYQHHRQRWSYWSSCGTGENPFQIQNDRGTAEVFRVGCAIERFILLSASHSHEVLARSLAICEAYWGPLPRVRPLWNECMFLSQSIVSIWRCTFLP